MRDAIGFMWANEGDIQALNDRPGLNGGQNRAEELRDELQKCIFHTDKENEIWIENWNREMERWKRDRDEALERIRMLKEKIFVPQKDMNEALNNLNRILKNRPGDYEWRSERVGEFWRFIRRYRDVEFNPNSNDQDSRWGITQGGTYNFSLFVFPEFEEGNIERSENGDFIVQRDFSFWSENEIYGFTQNADFKNTTFSQGANFGNTTFSQGANFGNTTFSQGANFGNTTFSQGANFGNATFSQYANFSNATFSQYANFSSATFSQGANFSNATFSQYANFSNATFSQDAYFSNVTFSKNADFSNAIFSQYTNFIGATFAQDANFIGAIFSKNSDFSNVTFSQGANFSSTTFSQYAYFSNATFTQDANFIGAIFSKNSDFSNVTFSQDANFIGAIFSKNSDFRWAIFTQRGIFENININNPEPGNLILSRLNLPSDTSQIILRNVRLRDLTISFINHRLTPDNFLIHNLDVSDPNGTIHFESVYLEDLKFVNVDWGDVSTRRISPRLYSDNPRAARDIYRQIKLALDKQENYIDARKFYALEIQAHGRELETELRDRSFPPISWIFAGIIHFSNALLGDNDFITTLSLQVASASLKTLSVLLYLVPALGLFFLVAYYTSYAPIVLALLLLLLILPHHRVPVLRSLGAFNSLIIYYLYGLTAGFGLSWVRPLLWLVGTVAVYTYLDNHLYQIYCDIALRIPENVRDVVVNAVYNISKNLNEFALNLLQFLPNQNLSSPDHPFLTLVFFVLSSYLIYQTIVALRRRVRR